jgi:uncharacterized protein YndB with AHSA1/START domain
LLSGRRGTMADITDWLRGTSREVLHDPGSRTVRLRRRHDATIEDVWDAWTDPDRLARWLTKIEGDLREGATVILSMSDTEKVSCQIVRCEPPHRLTITWSLPDEPDSAVELRLSPDGTDHTATRLELEHVALDERGWLPYAPSWEDYLARLDAWLGGRDPGSVSWSDNEAALRPLWRDADAAGTVSERWPTVSVDGPTATLRAAHTYPVRPGELWSAITEPDRLASWFGAYAEIDPRIGGTWAVTFDQGRATGVIEACSPGRGLTTSWRWDHDPVDAPAARLTVALEAVDGGTRLVLDHRGPWADSAVGYAAGWYAHLAGLATHLAIPTRPDAARAGDWNANFALARAVLRQATPTSANR